MARARFRNVQRARRRLKAIPFKVKRELQAALDKSGEELAAAMIRAAPLDDGDLRASIDYRKRDFLQQQDQLGGFVVAGNEKAFYARMVEFGTPEQAAQPYFYPTYRSFRRRMKSRRTRAVRKAIKSVLGVS